MKENFAIYRPRLASEPLSRGVKLTKKPNPYEPKRFMWVCPLNELSARITTEFYATIGKKLPEALEQKFKSIERG